VPLTTTDQLLERDAELAAIRAALSAGGLVIVDGAAGAGKTALLDAAAAGFDGLLLRARGAEFERSFAFGVVRQLFEGVDPGVFTGAARFAAALVGVEGVAAAPADDPFAARHALYWLAASLTAERPLALLVDDAHWADAASLGVLAHIAVRLEGLPLTMVLASRAGEPVLDALRRDASAVVDVPPLGAASAAAVVRALVPRADDALCRACHAATGGNAFLLEELARGLADGSVERSRVAQQSPERVTREIASRLSRLPSTAVALAQAAAVLGGGVPVRQAEALAGVSDASAVDALVGGGVLRSAHPLEFLHPLIGAAVYAGMGPAVRAREHARAARLLYEAGATPDRVAAQLLRCPPAGDEWAFERLLAAASHAGYRGAADAVATYLARALEEPAPAQRRTDVLLELGAAEGQFDAPAAVAHMREALDDELSVERRFAATMLLAGVLGHMGVTADAADVLEGQFGAFAARPDLLRSAEAALANITRIDAATRRRADAVIARMRDRVAAGIEVDPAVLGTIAAEMGMAGDPAATMAELAERALAGLEPHAATAEGWSWFNACRGLVVAEHYEPARHALDGALEQARERGAVMDVGGILTFRAELHVRTGELADAEVDARTLQEISVGYGWPLGAGMAAYALGEVLVARGELAEADAVLSAFGASAADVPEIYTNLMVLLARGRLRLAQGRIHEAVAELRECGRRACAIDHVNPAVVAWRSELALALAELGQTAEAGWLARDELERARAFGSPRALGIALLALGRVNEELSLLREAVGVLDGSAASLERARARFFLGAALRAAGSLDEARESLRLAIDLAHRCGARALEDAALGELRATGARPRRRLTTGAGSLTPSERRIAELAAAGRQNREIAEALFVTTATVEYHLRNAYRKLEISSRTQLGAALG
jgi:DNA-binding CsgD family transcriptional regulator